MDIDAAGGVATAGIVGAAIEKPTGEVGETSHGPCTDCGHETSGRFCSNCGQPTHVHRTLLHLGEEMLHGVMHFDARIWRTLPLLAINPGRLTREWVQGKRTRYVSPLAMFLFTVFVMFFAFSFLGAHPGVTAGDKAADLAQARGTLAAAEATLTELRAETGAERSEVAIRTGETMLKLAQDRVTSLESPGAGKRPDGLAVGSWQANVRDLVTTGNLDLGDGWLAHKIEKKLLNPDLALYKLQQTTYKFSFLLIPLSIPFVALLFLWRRGFTLYDHGVFVLYSLTAMSILFLLMAVLGPLWSGFGTIFFLLVVFGVPAHMFAQLKGAYGLSVFSAGWRTLMLLIFSLIVSLLFLAIIIGLGLTG